MAVKVNQEIKDCLAMIQACKNMMTVVNGIAVRTPDLSELCAEVVEMEREVIKHSINRIRKIKTGV